MRQLILGALLLLTTPVMGDELVWVRVVTEPEGAAVRDYQNDVLGTTPGPIPFPLPKDLSRQVNFTLEKEGYYPQTMVLTGRQLKSNPTYPVEGSLALAPHLSTSVSLFVRSYPWAVPLALLLLATPLILLRQRKSGLEAVSDFREETGPYQLSELLGEGGMATVYRGRSEEHTEEVAVKILRKDLCDDSTSRERFRREIQLSAKLRHPNLMHIYDWGETEQSRLYLVCELLEGETLKEKLQRQKKLEQEELLRILRGGGRRPRPPPPTGISTPRRQAGQHLPMPGWSNQTGRPGHRSQPGPGRSDPDRSSDGDSPLYGPGAD